MISPPSPSPPPPPPPSPPPSPPPLPPWPPRPEEGIYGATPACSFFAVDSIAPGLQSCSSQSSLTQLSTCCAALQQLQTTANCLCDGALWQIDSNFLDATHLFYSATKRCGMVIDCTAPPPPSQAPTASSPSARAPPPALPQQEPPSPDGIRAPLEPPSSTPPLPPSVVMSLAVQVSGQQGFSGTYALEAASSCSSLPSFRFNDM